jgi:hypothetical protein
MSRLQESIIQEKKGRLKDGDLNRYVKLAIDADSLGDRIEMVNYLISQGADFMDALEYSRDNDKTKIFQFLSNQLAN